MTFDKFTRFAGVVVSKTAIRNAKNVNCMAGTSRVSYRGLNGVKKLV